MNSVWPPEHTIRRSRRARRVSISLTTKKGLEVVIPFRTSVEEGLAFLNSQRQWVQKHLPALEKNKTDDQYFPHEITLAALNQTWSIRYHHVPFSKKIILRCLNDRLIFTGPIKSFTDCMPIFNQWLRRLAKTFLPDYLTRVSDEIQLPFNRVSIRSQKNLWGSCSSKNDISLNDRLLFLPDSLVRYVLIHELCHTIYFGHGKRFWQLVNRFDPDYHYNERSLRDVSKLIPSHFSV